MNRNLLIAMNLAWIAAVAGAYLIGRSSVDSEENSSSVDGVGSARVSSAMRGGSHGAASRKPGGEGRFDVSLLAGGPPDAERMEKLLARALGESNPILRNQALGNLLANLTLENIPAALKAFEEGPRNDETSRAFRDFLYAWGALDGPAAAAYALDEKSPRRTSYGSMHVMTGWATRDLKAAQEFVAAREDDGTKTWLHYGVFKTVMEGDLELAARYSEENTKSRARGYALDRLSAAFSKAGGPDALKAWLDGIDHEGPNDMVSYKSYAIRSAIDRIGRDHPEIAKSWIEENLGQPFVNFETLRRAAWAVGGRDAGKAMDWVTELPRSEERERAFGELVEHYANRNPNDMAQWLDARKDAPEFDAAASRFAQEIVDDDPISAIAWAQSIQAAERRDKTLRKVIKSWQKEDPGAAEAWMRENS